MAPLPVTSTQRFFLDYATSNQSHTLMVRANPPTSAAAFSTFMAAFLTALSGDLYNLQILSARVAQSGSNITSPIAWSGAASYGTGPEPANLAPRQLCFLGRSIDGRRARMFVFGWNGVTPGNFRADRTAHAAINSAYNVLEANNLFFVSISGQTTSKYGYADVNYNSYWERQVR